MNYDKKKFKNAVVFLAKNGGWDVGKKKLAKLLYFIDFTLYELRKKSLTEMPYAKMDYGPMPEPKTFYAALGDLQKTGVINIEERNSVGLERIVTQEKVDMDVERIMEFFTGLSFLDVDTEEAIDKTIL